MGVYPPVRSSLGLKHQLPFGNFTFTLPADVHGIPITTPTVQAGMSLSEPVQVTRSPALYCPEKHSAASEHGNAHISRHVFMHIPTHIPIYMFIHTYPFIPIYMFIHTHTYPFTCSFTQSCTYSYAWTYR